MLFDLFQAIGVRYFLAYSFDIKSVTAAQALVNYRYINP